MAHILPDPPAWDFRMASPPPLCPHGVPCAQRCTSCGWACPTCKRTYAPWVRECNYLHEEDRQARMGVQPGTFTPIRPVPVESRLVIALPPELVQADCMRYAKVSRYWTEILPGIQADCDQDVIIRLRLTPEGTVGESSER